MSDAAVTISNWAKPILEPEMAVRLHHDVRDGASPEAVTAAIGSLAPAIELVDLDGDTTDVQAILADNIFHWHVIPATSSRSPTPRSIASASRSRATTPPWPRKSTRLDSGETS